MSSNPSLNDMQELSQPFWDDIDREEQVRFDAAYQVFKQKMLSELTVIESSPESDLIKGYHEFPYVENKEYDKRFFAKFNDEEHTDIQLTPKYLGTRPRHSFARFTWKVEEEVVPDGEIDLENLFLGTNTNWVLKNVFGRNWDVDDKECPEGIWQSGRKYIFPNDTPKKLTIISSDKDDDEGKNGATEIIVIGLDEKFREISEKIKMNGKREVKTVQEYVRLNNAYVLKTGGSSGNEGDIYIRKEGLALGKMNKGTNGIYNAVYTVPKGKNGYIKRIHISTFQRTKKATDTSSSGGVSLEIRKPGGVFRSHVFLNLNEDTTLPVPVHVTVKDDIYLKIYEVIGKDFVVCGGFDLILKNTV